MILSKLFFFSLSINHKTRVRIFFKSYFFLCDLDGHIEDSKVQKSLEELGLHCEDFHVLGVFEADKFRENKS